MKKMISLGAMAALCALSMSAAIAQPITTPPRVQHAEPVLLAPTLAVPTLTGGLVAAPKKAMPILVPKPMAPAAPIEATVAVPVVDAKKVPRW